MKRLAAGRRPFFHGASRTATRVRVVIAGVLAAGTVVVGTMGLLGPLPAEAAGSTWYAYPAGTSTSTTSCPQTSTTTSECPLTQALSDAAAGDTVALATPGVEGTSSTYYIGNFTVATAGTSATSQVTIEPAVGITDPILDGGGSGTVLTVNMDVFATAEGVSIQDGSTAPGTGGTAGSAGVGGALGGSAGGTGGLGGIGGNGGNGGGISNSGTLTVTDSTISGNSTGSGGAGGQGGDGGLGGTGNFSDGGPGGSGGIGGTGGTGGNGGRGAGIYNGGTLTVTDSTISGNTTGSGGTGGTGGLGGNGGDGDLGGFAGGLGGPAAAAGNGGTGGLGGGIYNGGTLTVTDSTISGNATGSGGTGGLGGDGAEGGMGGTGSVGASGGPGGGGGSGGDGGNGALGGNGGSGSGISNVGTLTVTDGTISGNTTGSGGTGGPGGNGGSGTSGAAGGTGTVGASGNGGNGGNGGSGADGGPGGTGGLGGGISNGGMLTITSGTISGNTTGSGGAGGISGDSGSGGQGAPPGFGAGGEGNFGNPGVPGVPGVPGGAGGSGNGGGVYAASAASVAASILTGNPTDGLPDNSPDNCAGLASPPVTDDGYNVADDASCDFSGSGEDVADSAVGLGSLQNNGGSTSTESIPSTSIAATLVAVCPTASDQRGNLRPTTDCSAGAYQVPSPPPITFNPCPNGEMSCASASSTTPGGSATATNDGVTVTAAEGEGTFTVGQYGSDPDTALSSGTGEYFGVQLEPGNTFTSLTITDTNLGGGDSFFWWNQSAWVPVGGDPGPTYSPGPPPSLVVTLDSTTGPTLSELTGTPFAVINASVPGAPSALSATPGNASASFAWSAPTSDGGAPVTSYTLTCSPSGSATASSTRATLSGLTNSITYSCAVAATNVAGSGPSSSSVSFTPSAPAPPPAPPASPCLSFSADAAFICATYEDLLNRAPDSGGLSYFEAQLAGGATRTKVANDILQSAEYKDDLVEAIYERYLGRAADPDGLSTYAGLLSSGSTQEQVIADIVGSAEFFSDAGSSNQGFVTLAYERILARSPDPGGLATYMGLLGRGAGRTQVAHDMLSSTEYRTDTISYYYEQLLGRTPDPGGLANALGLLSSGTTDQELIADIVGSQEFYNDATR
jgi:Domain of unknown function (DUF4214)/Fibronectin type III domain